MLSKLEKYSKYIHLSWQSKIRLIKQAKASDQFRGPIPRGNKCFSEENFAYFSVFDTYKQQNMYKLRTYREGGDIKNPKAVVAMFHGLTSHMNRGAHIAKYLAERDIITVGYDFRGFGKSEGLKGYIQDMDTLLKDSYKFVQLVKEIYPNLPIYGMGLSLGGGTAYHLSLKHKDLFQGTILMAPALMPPMQMSKYMTVIRILFRLLEIILPGTSRIRKQRFWQNSKNPNYKQYCINDPYYQRERLRLRTMNCIFEWFQYSLETFKDYQVPFMVIHGGADKLIDPNLAFQLFQKSKTAIQDKQVLFYEKLHHDIWSEPEIVEIQEQVANWILDRVAKLKNDL